MLVSAPAHMILALIKATFDTHASVSSGARGLIFGLSLPLHPYFLHGRRGGPVETTHISLSEHLQLSKCYLLLWVAFTAMRSQRNKKNIIATSHFKNKII